MFVVVVLFCIHYYCSLLISGFFKEIFVEFSKLPIEDGSSFVNHGYGYSFEGVFCLITYYYSYYKHISEGL